MIYKYKSLANIFLAMSVCSGLCGCLKENFEGCPEEEGRVSINLSMQDMPDIDITTRSQASSEECNISNLAVLVFNQDGKFKEEDEIDVDHQLTDGTVSRTVTAFISPIEGETLTIVANYQKQGNLEPGVSEPADINNVYLPANTLNAPNPMSGSTVYTTSDAVTCSLKRSVSKIQLSLSADITKNDVTGDFSKDNVTWKVCNILSPEKGMLYLEDKASETIPVREGLGNSDFISADSFISTDSFYYVPEYPNSTSAKTEKFEKNVFSKDRQCLLLNVKGKYYRLDFSKQTSSTGFDQQAANEFLDIVRNTHVTFTVNGVKSTGYDTPEEALANPGSNIEYTISMDFGEWNGATSNGQYAVKTDGKRCIVVNGVSSALNLVKFTTQMPDSGSGTGDGLPGSVTTCKARILLSDKSTPVPVEQIQLCKSDGTPAGNTELDLSSETIGKEGYQLKYISGEEYPQEQCFVEIQFGNIRHYVPIGKAVFEISTSTPAQHDGGTYPVSVSSHVVFENETLSLGWTASVVETPDSWISFPTSGREGNTDATLKPQTPIHSNDHNDRLKSNTPVGTGGVRYDLSTQGGSTAMNTSNCYIVNAKGKYSLPLVYGNAIKNGADNPSAYRTSNTGQGILQEFWTYDYYKRITQPYIYKDKMPANAKIIWQDVEGMVTSASLSVSKDKLEFDIGDNIRQGNAVIAITDESNTAMWSWHIWVTDYEPNKEPDNSAHDFDSTLKDKVVQSYLVGENIMMPVNLGWCDGDRLTYAARKGKIRFTQETTGFVKDFEIIQPEVITHAAGNSTYYQFGRYTPMPAFDMTGSDREHLERKPVYPSNGFQIHQLQPAITTSIRNPGVFFTNTINDDWHVSTEKYDNLWDAGYTSGTLIREKTIKTVYDPSPAGYCVPQYGVFGVMTYSGNAYTVSSGYSPTVNSPYLSVEEYLDNNGIIMFCNTMKGEGFYDKTGGSVYFPLSGILNYYDGGYLKYNGEEHVFLWSSTRTAEQRNRSLNLLVGETYVNPSDSSIGAHGLPVRAIREK